MDWIYVTYRVLEDGKGYLYDEDENLYCSQSFTCDTEADEYIVKNNLRATIV